ncbi:hypothetical protein AVEN_100852-1 [Araneus ventricosus]|uniref:Uncharacterized protein n=1 Tax=Araneus ventricosus TaxID=182803 RepID=A0A4Y2AW66_ARAVE|nr:hypothetical protein AVEN_100852-1 [Araneus ventricosus]
MDGYCIAQRRCCRRLHSLVPDCSRVWPPLRMASRWPSDYFLFPKLKEHLSGTRFGSDAKTVAENWLNRQDAISAKPGQTSWSCVQIGKYLNRFGNYV